MSKFSLITVSEQEHDIVSGYWIANHTGTLKSACDLAGTLSGINSGQDIAVVEQINSTVPVRNYYTGLKRLDYTIQRIWVTLNDSEETTETHYIKDGLQGTEIIEELNKVFGKGSWLAFSK